MAADVLGPERGEDRAPIGGEPFDVQQDRKDVPGVADIGRHVGQQEPRLRGKLRAIALGQLGPSLQELVELGELGESERARRHR